MREYGQYFYFSFWAKQPKFMPLLTLWLLADKAYSSTKFIKQIKDCLQHVTTNRHVASWLLFTLRVF